MGKCALGREVWGLCNLESVSAPLFKHIYSSVFTGRQELSLCNYFVLANWGKIGGGGSLSVWGRRLPPSTLNPAKRWPHFEMSLEVSLSLFMYGEHPVTSSYSSTPRLHQSAVCVGGEGAGSIIVCHTHTVTQSQEPCKHCLDVCPNYVYKVPGIVLKFSKPNT